MRAARALPPSDALEAAGDEPRRAPAIALPRDQPVVRFAAGPFERRLLLLAVVGFALRVAVVFAVPTRPTSDSWSYFQRGANILHHGRYEAFPDSLDATYPPGYPLALAAAMAVAPAAKALASAKLLSCALGFSSILLIGLTGRRLFGPPTGLFAAALLAFYPRHILQAAVLLSEHLFLPLLLLLLTILVTVWDRPSARRAAAVAGAVTGLLSLVRPVGYLLGFLWTGRLFARHRKWRVVFVELALLLGTQHVAMLPWAIRNHVTLGSFSFLSSAGGVDLFIGNNPRASGGWMAWRPVLEEMEPAARDARLGCFAIDGLARDAALGWIRENPAAAVGLYFQKLGQILGPGDFLVYFAITGKDLWPPPGGTDALPPGHPAPAFSPAIQTLSTWSFALVAALAALALLAIVRRRLLRRPTASGAELLPAVAAAYFPLVAAAFLSSTRFRWPTEELLVLLAAHALSIGVGRRPPSDSRIER